MEMMILMLIMSFIGNTADAAADSPGEFAFDSEGLVDGNPEDSWDVSSILGGLDDAVLDTWEDSSKWVPDATASAGTITVANDSGLLESIGGKSLDEADIFSKPYFWLGAGVLAFLAIKG